MSIWAGEFGGRLSDTLAREIAVKNGHDKVLYRDRIQAGMCVITGVLVVVGFFISGYVFPVIKTLQEYFIDSGYVIKILGIVICAVIYLCSICLLAVFRFYVTALIFLVSLAYCLSVFIYACNHA